MVIFHSLLRMDNGDVHLTEFQRDPEFEAHIVSALTSILQQLCDRSEVNQASTGKVCIKNVAMAKPLEMCILYCANGDGIFLIGFLKTCW